MTTKDKEAFIKEYKMLCLKHNCFLSWKQNIKRNIVFLQVKEITYSSNIEFIDGCISINGEDAPIYK